MIPWLLKKSWSWLNRLVVKYRVAWVITFSSITFCILKPFFLRSTGASIHSPVRERWEKFKQRERLVQQEDSCGHRHWLNAFFFIHFKAVVLADTILYWERHVVHKGSNMVQLTLFIPSIPGLDEYIFLTLAQPALPFYYRSSSWLAGCLFTYWDMMCLDYQCWCSLILLHKGLLA